jgi:hypothetical protein
MQGLESLLTVSTQSNSNHPAVNAATLTSDIPEPFKSIEESGHIRNLGDKLLADITTRLSALSGTFQDAQDAKCGAG